MSTATIKLAPDLAPTRRAVSRLALTALTLCEVGRCLIRDLTRELGFDEVQAAGGAAFAAEPVLEIIEE